MDETFVAESFKGNHIKSGFLMPRKSRKRGKEVKKRGISSEQVCIATAIDKNDNTIIEMVCRGRVSSKKLNELYSGHVAEGSVVTTDSLSGYKNLSKNLKLKHKPILSGKHSNGVFNLARINSLHNKFKTWIRRFNGVSTKFLPNYLKWFKWLESVRGCLDESKIDKMWGASMGKLVDVRIRTIREREIRFAVG
jgi:transposase-like protein